VIAGGAPASGGSAGRRGRGAHQLVLPGLVLAALIAVGPDVTRASEGEPGPAAATAPTDRDVVYGIDPPGSGVTFVLRTTWHDVRGRSGGVTGTIRSRSGDLFDDAGVDVVVDATTMETGNARRDRKMHEEFLLTATWPVIRFRSGAPPHVIGRIVEGATEAGDAIRFTLSGDLEIRGATRPVVLALTARREGEGWRVTGEHEVSLQEYGIPDPSILINRVRDTVTVSLSILAIPRNPPNDAD